MEFKDILNIDNLIRQVEKNIQEYLHKIPESKQERNKIRGLLNTINAALSGDAKYRKTVIEYIKNMISNTFDIYKLDEDLKATDVVLSECKVDKNNIEDVINFEKNELTDRDKFEIILHQFDKKYGKNAFSKIREKYNYTKKRKESAHVNLCYEYTCDDINEIYTLEKTNMTYEDKLDIIGTRIYAEIYGLSEIDSLTYQNINEVGISDNYVYCWDTDKIRLNFFDISENKLELIQNKAILFDKSAKQLDYSNPEVLTHRIDDSRVTVVQKPYSTERHIAIRIFNQKQAGLDDLYDDERQKTLMMTLVKTGQSIVFQGGLGTGKTTTMSTLIGGLDDILHIGTIEDYFEQHNRKKYEGKRIVELQKTEDKTLLDGVKTLLRMSIDVADVGEIRDGEALFAFIQLLQSVSVGAWCTTHVVNPETTVPRLKNMLMGTGKYSTEQSAVMDIISYINCIFQHEIINGKRMITKIVEIIPLVSATNDIDFDMNMDKEKLEKMVLIEQIRSNLNNMYKLNYIMEADIDGKLKFVNYPSQKMIEKANKTRDGQEYMKKLIDMMQKEIG
ncbi:MAG TPA: hypothetical protein DCP90_08580 [Clostridiales bacterium]|nr:MAG: hypothetical protein A2Y22_05845 [Clostridiales bacterium GWD2_32_59]HAN10649.1 hypothetical protein [Clostridiales bacterium]